MPTVSLGEQRSLARDIGLSFFHGPLITLPTEYWDYEGCE